MAAPDPCPDLEPGITVLDVDQRRSGALYQLAVAELQQAAGAVYWIDARNAASTYALYDVAPHDRVLSDLRIARAFTAHQHYTLVRRLIHAVDDETSLIVAPNLASLYRDDDLADWERDDLYTAAVETLAALSSSYDLPVLVTAPDAGPLADVWHDHATSVLECTATAFGYRFEGDDFETDVYWDGGAWQTTIPYWVELLGAVTESTVDPIATAADRDLLTVDRGMES